MVANTCDRELDRNSVTPARRPSDLYASGLNVPQPLPSLIRNYSWWRRLSEHIEGAVLGESWPADLVSRIWPPTLRIWQETVTLQKRLGTAERFRIAFASDFHAGPFTPAATIASACQALSAAKADLILLGGDFVSIAARHATRLHEPLSSLTAPLGVFAALGNHDHWAGAAAVTAVLEGAGVSLLTNRSHRLPAPFERTLLVGLDDHLSGSPDSSGPDWDPRSVTLLLIHQPSGLLDTGGHSFDLAVAGHTHGGQITLPGGLAPIVPKGALSRRYLAGRYPLDGGRHLLVSVGLGNSGLPIRLGPVPEILVCDVVGAPAPGD